MSEQLRVKYYVRQASPEERRYREQLQWVVEKQERVDLVIGRIHESTTVAFLVYRMGPLCRIVVVEKHTGIPVVVLDSFKELLNHFMAKSEGGAA